MGSILSFPILCLANLGLYFGLMTSQGHDLSMKQLIQSVLVNGDDMLYIGSDDLFRHHSLLGVKVGLEMSVGKAYCHSNYANINSISLHCSSVGRKISTPASCTVQPYFNTGLFFGQSKVLGGSETRHSNGVVQSTATSTIDWLLYGCPKRFRCSVLAVFLRRFRQEVLSESSVGIRCSRQELKGTRNLFLPISVGGLGLRPPEDWKFSISCFQRLLARCILANATSDISCQRPLPGREIIRSSPSDTPWSLDLSKVVEETPFQELRVRCGVTALPRLPSDWYCGFVPYESLIGH